MTIETDTAWLRERLSLDWFHREFTQRWVAVRDARIVFHTPESGAMAQWLEREDPDHRCVLAFADDRLLA
jgi:hypothetical protein